MKGETWQEYYSRIHAYSEQLPRIFPELFDGQANFRLIVSDNNGDDNRHKFTLINGIHDDDLPCFKYDINLEKSKYELVYNCNCHVVANNYEDLVEKRRSVIEDKIDFIRVPEFQAKVWLGQYGVDFWANGARMFCSQAHTSDKTMEGCVTFATRYLHDSYSDYIWPRKYEFGYIERERRVEQAQLKKELSKVKKRKNEKAKKERDDSPEFSIFIEETTDYDLSLRYSWPGITGEKRISTSASKEEIAAAFKEIFKKYFA